MLAGGDPQDDPETAVTLALVAAYQSDLERARQLAIRGRELAEASDQPFFVSWYDGILGLLEHWGGHPDAAVESFARAMRIREALCFREPASPPYRVDYVEALLALGRIEAALAVLEPWESAAERLGRRWALAETTRSRGLVAAARGDVEGAARLLTEAVTRHQEVGDRFGGARALLALGVVRRRARQKQAARETIQQALTEFEQLGAQTWADKARGELGSIGGRTREEGLTAAERRVAELAAQGRTNREVAAALFLSERTVESHLTHVYAKLGVRSRTELSRSLR
jgi:DNA-binding CsgD family transcriptional regulator